MTSATTRFWYVNTYNLTGMFITVEMKSKNVNIELTKITTNMALTNTNLYVNHNSGVTPVLIKLQRSNIQIHYKII